MAFPPFQDQCSYCSVEATAQHVIFDCPAVQRIQDEYKDLFRPSTASVGAFQLQNDLTSVVRFLIQSEVGNQGSRLVPGLQQL
jgi:hypothetical protein